MDKVLRPGTRKPQEGSRCSQRNQCREAGHIERGFCLLCTVFFNCLSGVLQRKSSYLFKSKYTSTCLVGKLLMSQGFLSEQENKKVSALNLWKWDYQRKTHHREKKKLGVFIFKMQKLAENNSTHHKHFVMFTKKIYWEGIQEISNIPHAVFAFKNKSREQNYIWNTLTMDRFFYQFNKTEVTQNRGWNEKLHSSPTH